MVTLLFFRISCINLKYLALTDSCSQASNVALVNLFVLYIAFIKQQKTSKFRSHNVTLFNRKCVEDYFLTFSFTFRVNGCLIRYFFIFHLEIEN